MVTQQQSVGSNSEPSAPHLTGQGLALAGVTVFLDRDGTLNPDPGYIADPSHFELFPGAAAALARLKRAGARLIVVTNQSGIARNKFTLDDLDLIHGKLRSLLAADGVALDAIYFCPHHPDEQCRCRKPGTAMVEQAKKEFPLDLSRAYMIGDQARDVEMALRVGIASILVTTGVDAEKALAELRRAGVAPKKSVASLAEAADWIIMTSLDNAQLPEAGARNDRPI